MPTAQSYFEVDKDGLAEVVRRRHPGFIFAELLANAFDQPGTTHVSVSHEPVPGKALVDITVRDNDPTGFEDLRDAYTLFRYTKKRKDAQVRGRFNLGEKEFLSICKEASITTTIGQVVFKDDTRTVNRRNKTEKGTEVKALVKMTRDDYESAVEFLEMIIPPEHIEVDIGGGTLTRPETGRGLVISRIVGDFETTLPTEIEDEESGGLRKTARKTRVVVSTVPKHRESAWIFEMGIPVCEIPDDEWDIDVQQKVPLSRDRDSVTPGYLLKLRVAALNNCYDELDEDAAAESWVTEAVSDKNVDEDAFSAAMTKRFGEDAVVYDPSDPEANSRAASEGRQVIHGRTIPKGAHDNVKRFTTFRPAGQVIPTSKAQFSSNGKPFEIKNYTPEMGEFCAYVKWLAGKLLGKDWIRVAIGNSQQNYGACFGEGSCLFNLRRLGRRWFQTWKSNLVNVNDLIIHEFAHDIAEDHLSDGYHKACTKLGAKLAQLVFEEYDEYAERVQE